jgi:hypothetical protein
MPPGDARQSKRGLLTAAAVQARAGRMKMRSLASALLLAGCAGNVADYVGPRAGILTPQLIRYGMSLADARCVGDRLGKGLSPLQLRRLVRAASAVKAGYYEPGPLTPRHFRLAAGSTAKPKVLAELESGYAACGIVAEPAVAATAPQPVPAVPGETAAAAAARSAAWLNLGAANSGQSIAIDASTIEQEASSRTAWFRLTDPGASAPGENAYRLRIDCGGRTIAEKARRKRDTAGALVETPAEDKPLPIEGGTVMEIAWLALCT